MSGGLPALPEVPALPPLLDVPLDPPVPVLPPLPDVPLEPPSAVVPPLPLEPPLLVPPLPVSPEAPESPPLSSSSLLEEEHALVAASKLELKATKSKERRRDLGMKAPYTGRPPRNSAQCSAGVRRPDVRCS